MPASPPTKARWLLLVHQLPKDPAYLRVKIGRRLAHVGAVALKSSVYVLPAKERTLEDFQWVRREVLEGGGEATVVEAAFVEGMTDVELEGRFREEKDRAYQELIDAARALVPARRKRALRPDERATLIAQIAQIDRRLQEVVVTDFFGASGREVLGGLLKGLRERAGPEREVVPEPPKRPVRGATWVTRTGIHVDRIASAWLVKRFIDPEATFEFVPAKGYAPKDGEIRFDMFEAEYSHEGDRCTFETLLARFGVEEPGLAAIGEVVHDIDVKDGKFGRPETPGVAACILGICRGSPEDAARLARGSDLFEGLLAYFSRRV